MKNAIGRVVFALFLVAGARAWAQETPPNAMTADIRTLIEVTGAGEAGVKMMQDMIASMREVLPDVPEEYWTRFAAKVDPDGLIQLCIPIYAKHFAHEEVKQLLEFYRTPLGQKLITALPAVAEEAMAVGQQWGESLAAQVLQELNVDERD